MTPDFQGLLRTLVDGGVDFIVIGGVAGAVHGSAQATYGSPLAVPIQRARATGGYARR